MATLPTRSSRRTWGTSTKPALTQHQNNTQTEQTHPTTARRKRRRESFEDERDRNKLKRVKVTTEIELRLKSQPKRRLGVDDIDAKPEVAVVSQSSAPQKATINTAPTRKSAPTNHAQKVATGVKRELDNLRVSLPDKLDEKRTLRSQEGHRYKSELSAYFPEYDVVIGNEPEEIHFLNVDTPITILDSKAQVEEKTPPNTKKLRNVKTHRSPQRVRLFAGSLFDDLYQSQKVDYSFLDKLHRKGTVQEDPLPDSYYDQAHRRAERLERSIRNSEKGRAQHERDQVIRLIEGLQGHDWLKVMGVSGITEGKKKDFTPAREYFIKGCLTIIEKFRQWREEEKRRKQLKLAEAAAGDEAEEEEGEWEEEEQDEQEMDEAGEQDEDNLGNESDGDPPDYSDVDHAAARQLHEEAIARSAPHTTSRKGRHKPEAEPPPVEEPEEFKSFYSKRHLREAAIGKNRRSGRTASAWGQPVPDVPQSDFELPEEYRDREVLESHARRRRRVRRLSREQ